MKCIRCGYESPAQFVKCPSCGMTQSSSLNNRKERTGGESAAIIISIIASVISFIAAFIIFTGFCGSVVTKAMENNSFGIDSPDDFDSNEYDDLEDFFWNYYNNKEKKDSSVGLNTPVKFKDTLFSFSAEDVEAEYEVSMVECYRGEAALKLLEGEKLPLYDELRNDIYLVKFNVKITEQNNDAIVIVPTGSPVAYPSNTVAIFSEGYDYISDLSYANAKKLVTKDQETEVWHAFIVSKEDERPCIRWKYMDSNVFRNKEKAISDASLVEAGSAIEIENKEESETSSETESED